MPRKLPEWVGASPDSAVPPRVKQRVFVLHNGRCASCTRRLYYKKWECDHIVAIINGGENREKNLQVLCPECHTGKTAGDVAEKVVVSRIKAKHIGVKKKPSGRGFLTNRDGKWKAKIGGGAERRVK